VSITPEILELQHKLNEHGLHVDHPEYITTYTHERIDPMNAKPSQIHVADIAHSLARTCRYNGHVSGFLSVARHSLWVSQRLVVTGHRDLALAGLLHDAAEAYLGDVPRPLKYRPEMAGYRDAEARLERVIALRFWLTYPMPEAVAKADAWVLTHMELPHERWSWNTTPKQDAEDFLTRFTELDRSTPCE
jgi:hypothetical protein